MTHASNRVVRSPFVVLALLAMLAITAPASAQPRPDLLTFAALQAQIVDLRNQVGRLRESQGAGVPRQEIDALSRRIGALEGELQRMRDALPGDWRPNITRLNQELERERSERTSQSQRFATKDDLNREIADLRGLPGALAAVEQKVGALEQAVTTLQSRIADLIASSTPDPVQAIPLNPLIDLSGIPTLLAFDVADVPADGGNGGPPPNDLIPFLFTLAIAGALVGANTWQQYRAKLRARIATEVETSGEETQALSVRERAEGPRHVVCYQFVGGMDAQESFAADEAGEPNDQFLRQEKVA